MIDPIESKILKWDSRPKPGEENKFSNINRQIIHLNVRLFNDYEPHQGPNSDFFVKLNKWLDNLNNEEDQKHLFELVTQLFYIGREELNVLYREAYITNYARWLIDVLSIDFFSKDVATKIANGIEQTWFCPLTDSLRINQFYHINNIPAKNDFRPDWRSLVKFGDINLIKDYIHAQGIKQIVLLEDFIGNGSQVGKAVNFAIKNLPEIPILVIPLIICPTGVESSLKLSNQTKNIVISPVISLQNENFLYQDETLVATDFFKKISKLAMKTYEQVSCSSIIDEDNDPYGPFGFRKTGALVIMQTNTPNNTLPMIHYESEQWNPLFKRHKRV